LLVRARLIVVTDAVSVALRAHAVLEAPPDHPELIVASVGPRGESISLWCRAEDAPWFKGGPLVEGLQHSARTVDPHEVVVVRESMENVLVRLGVSFPLVQPLPQGEVLIVGARCLHRYYGRCGHNALRFSADGEQVASACFGDGIGHLLATRSGSAWVGYRDEGVFADRGWAPPGGPDPLGSPGINRFGCDLVRQWSFPASASLGMMADCYALNVGGELVWASYYDGFPTVCIDDGEVRTWTNAVIGAVALIVDDGWIALVGGYPGEHDRVVLARLVDHHVAATEVLRLTWPDGSALSPRTRFVAHGAELDVFNGPKRYRISVSDLRNHG
jgi:hypothetical protein